MIISIVGTSGVGKSLLVKQLAALECAPAFFEGEEGVIPEDIFESVFNQENILKRGKWFIERYRKNLEKARKVSDAGIDCYVDGAMMSVHAALSYEDESVEKDILIEFAKEFDHLESDLVVLLTVTREKLKEFIEKRGRVSEQRDETVERSLKIQEAFEKLVDKSENGIVIDRSDLDFFKEKDLKIILEEIKSYKSK